MRSVASLWLAEEHNTGGGSLVGSFDEDLRLPVQVFRAAKAMAFVLLTSCDREGRPKKKRSMLSPHELSTALCMVRRTGLVCSRVYLLITR